MPAPAHEAFRWRSVNLVWLPVLAFLLAEATSRLVAAKPAGLGHFTATASEWSEASARFQLLALMFLFFCVAVAVFFKFFTDIANLFDWKSRVRIMAAYLICLVAAGAVAVLIAGPLPRTNEHMGLELFESLTSATTDRLLWGPKVFAGILEVFDVIAALSIAAFIAGGVSCVSNLQQLSDSENWIFQAERLKSYLYLSAGVLVVGILALRAWVQYPAYLINNDALEKSYGALVNSYIMFQGVEFSVVLAAYALPVALILSRRADRIAAHLVRQEEGVATAPVLPPFSSKTQAVRNREKLVISSQDVLKTVAALVAPLVTGTVASLSSVVG